MNSFRSLSSDLDSKGAQSLIINSKLSSEKSREEQLVDKLSNQIREFKLSQ